ncbi:Golgi-associated RAB2 interactor protein 6-like [Heptranchias perlo]|uniref:Golgi-associated RAB2 interactor protein 6-like n=1 Tax=Heptranchias perlo TaxID=212740 RepID=UPI00355A8599
MSSWPVVSLELPLPRAFVRKQTSLNSVLTSAAERKFPKNEALQKKVFRLHPSIILMPDQPATESEIPEPRICSEKVTFDIRSYLFYNLLEDIGAVPTSCVGEMQQHLYNGDFLLFKTAPIFESNFIQVSKKGHVSDIHHRVSMVTIGVSSTDPTLYIPDVLLIAQPSERQKQLQLQIFNRTPRNTGSPESQLHCGTFTPLQLLRLFPLKLTKISIYDEKNHRLRLKLATHQSFYLQLIGIDPKFEDEMFQYWVKLVQHIYTQARDVCTLPRVS